MTTKADEMRHGSAQVFNEIVQPSEPSEFAMNELDPIATGRLQVTSSLANTRAVLKVEALDSNSPKSDFLTCNLLSQNGSPKINQEAVRQILARDLSRGNRIANKNLHEANIVLASNNHAAFSPQETSRTKSADMPI